MYAACVSEVELLGADGDSKDDTKDTDNINWLLIWTSVQLTLHFTACEGVIFYKITLHGLLVNYFQQGRIANVYKMVFDFDERETKLIKCDNTNLRLSEGFSRVASALKQAVVVRREAYILLSFTTFFQDFYFTLHIIRDKDFLFGVTWG